MIFRKKFTPISAARAAVLAGLVAIAVSATPPRALAQDAPQRLVVASPTGQLHEVIKKAFVPWERDNNVKIDWVPSIATETLAKLVATKNNPEFEVAFLNDDTHYAGSLRGVWAPVDEKIVTNYKHLLPAGRPEHNDGVAYMFYFAGIYYQPTEFQKRGWAPPKSWTDLLRQEYCGRVGLFHITNTYGLHFLLMLANKDPANRMDDAIAQVLKHKACVPALERSPAKMEEKVQLGDYLVGVMQFGRGLAIIDRDVPIKMVRAQEGEYLGYATAGVVRNDAKPEKMALAQKFINWLIAPPTQTALMKEMYLQPANETVEVPKELADRGIPTLAEMKKMPPVPLKIAAERRSAWARMLDRGMMH